MVSGTKRRADAHVFQPAAVDLLAEKRNVVPSSVGTPVKDVISWCCFPFRTFGGSGQLERRSNNVPASDASDQAFIRHYHMSVIFAGIHVENRSGRLRCCTGRSRHATPSNSSHLARLMRLAIVVQNQDRLLLQKFVL